jgi:hypothetical protein
MFSRGISLHSQAEASAQRFSIGSPEYPMAIFVSLPFAGHDLYVHLPFNHRR